MRTSIMNSLFARMLTDKNIFFLTADFGINLVEKFRDAYPTRFLNVGIAEQNLIGISAGLCNLGFRPFVYTISNFLIHRCYEQIRNDIALHDYPITLLGTSAGFDNAPLGPTHHIINDWGALRTIPGIDIYIPSSITYASHLIDKIIDNGHPAYVRIAKESFEQPISLEDVVYIEAKIKDMLLISYGALSQNCLKVHEAHDNVSVLICNRVRPLEESLFREALSAHQKNIVIEDHYSSSGLFSVLSQFCVKHRIVNELISIAPTEGFMLKVGRSADYYYKLYHLDVNGIETVLSCV